ncbi:hypothetical protein [Sphingobium nicotianae]|uniref:Uncharacterized protein n=1 Tax=Sphingobium nicotianae TaxID=2782607 RepID=A0A9X1DFQ7_9SPHN|nr:hypothetical protein [Sphingobium nicotianae]MBT2189452.1 hypothetical protein [Sphingobium nicotianae]
MIHSRRQAHDRPLGEIGQFLLQEIFLAFQILEARHDGAGKIVVFFHLLHQLTDSTARLGKPGLHLIAATMGCARQSIELALKMHREPPDDLRRGQSIAEGAGNGSEVPSSLARYRTPT